MNETTTLLAREIALRAAIDYHKFLSEYPNVPLPTVQSTKMTATLFEQWLTREKGD